MVWAACCGQHAAGGGRAGVHCVSFQWLVHGDRDWSARFLRRSALQHPEGNLLEGTWAGLQREGTLQEQFWKRDTSSVHWDGREPLPAL